MNINCVGGNNGNGKRVLLGNCKVFSVVKITLENENCFFVVLGKQAHTTRLLSIDKRTRGNYMVITNDKEVSAAMSANLTAAF